MPYYGDDQVAQELMLQRLREAIQPVNLAFAEKYQ